MNKRHCKIVVLAFLVLLITYVISSWSIPYQPILSSFSKALRFVLTFHLLTLDYAALQIAEFLRKT